MIRDMINYALNEFNDIHSIGFESGSGISVDDIFRGAEIKSYDGLPFTVIDVFRSVSVVKAWSWIAKFINYKRIVDVDFVAGVAEALGIRHTDILKARWDNIEELLSSIRKENGSVYPPTLYVGLRMILRVGSEDLSRNYYGDWGETVAFLVTLYECVTFHGCVFRVPNAPLVGDEKAKGDPCDVVISGMFDKIEQGYMEVPYVIVKVVRDNCFYGSCWDRVVFADPLK